MPGHDGRPSCRWSLTPPFHPYDRADPVAVCSLLRLPRITPPGSYPAPCPGESGRSSPRPRDRVVARSPSSSPPEVREGTAWRGHRHPPTDGQPPWRGLLATVAARTARGALREHTGRPTAGGGGQSAPRQPRRGHLASQRRGAGHGPAPRGGGGRRALGRLGRRRDRRPRPRRGLRRPPAPAGAVGGAGPRVLRGLLEPDPVAAVPRPAEGTGDRPGLVAHLRGGQPPLRRGRRGTARVQPRVLGAGLPPDDGPPDAAQPAPRRADRLLPAHPLPAAGAGGAAAVAGRPAGRAARGGRAGLPHRVVPGQLRPVGPAVPPGRDGLGGRDLPPGRPCRAHGRPPDLDRRGRVRPARDLRAVRVRAGRPARAVRRPAGLPRCGPAGLHQGHPPPPPGHPARPCRPPRAAPRVRLRPDRGALPRGRRGVPGAARPGRAHRRDDQRPVHRTRPRRAGALPAPGRPATLAWPRTTVLPT